MDIFTLFGRIIVDSADAEQNLDGLEKSAQNTERSFDNLRKAGLAVGAAATAVGGAMQFLTNRSTELNTGLRRVEAATGASADELRDMIIAVTDHTFTLDDAVAATERLVQANVRSKDEIEALLPVFDTFADATGKNIVEGIDAFDRALSALGIPLTEAAEHLDTFTFLETQTTVGMQEMGMVFRREARAIRETGLTMEDVAVAMASLEAEGRRGPRAVMGLQEALKNAEGDINAFWQALGVSNETLETQNSRLADSAGLTQELADINNASLTIWDKVRHRFDVLTFQAGTMLEPFRDLGPILMALGPLMMGVSAAAGVLRTAFLMLAGASGIGIILVALAAVTTAGVLLMANWDRVRSAAEGLASWFRVVFSRLWGWMRDQFFGLLDSRFKWLIMLLVPGGPILAAVFHFRDEIVGAFEWVRDKVTAAIDFLAGPVNRLIGWVRALGTEHQTAEVTAAEHARELERFGVTVADVADEVEDNTHALDDNRSAADELGRSLRQLSARQMASAFATAIHTGAVDGDTDAMLAAEMSVLEQIGRLLEFEKRIEDTTKSLIDSARETLGWTDETERSATAADRASSATSRLKSEKDQLAASTNKAADAYRGLTQALSRLDEQAASIDLFERMVAQGHDAETAMRIAQGEAERQRTPLDFLGALVSAGADPAGAIEAARLAEQTARMNAVLYGTNVPGGIPRVGDGIAGGMTGGVNQTFNVTVQDTSPATLQNTLQMSGIEAATSLRNAGVTP